MEVLKLSEFLKLFNTTTNKNIEFDDFFNKAKVKIGNRLVPLNLYIREKSISKKDIRLLFNNIKNRDDYLTRFYNMSMRINPDKIHFDGVPIMDINHTDNNKEVVYKNFIRNIHYRDILQNTKSGFDNNRPFLEVLFELYKKNIIDYKILTPSSLFYMNQGRLGSVFSSYYFRASIMNPYLVYSLNKSTLKGTRIFTPTLGWTSYAYGFLECPEVIEYVGTDVIPEVCEKTENFIKSHSPKITSRIFCKPSEKLLKSNPFMNMYKEHFDLVFFSPPYYKLELYEGGLQSTESYKTYEDWLSKYWEKTIQLCHYVLEKGGKLCYILSGYGSDNTDKYDLISDMNHITEKYFQLISIKPMYNKDVHVTKHKETAEKIIIFKKR